MSYTTDSKEIMERAEKIAAKMDTYTETPIEALYHPHMRDGHEVEDWQSLRADLATLLAGGEPEKDGTKLRTLIAVYGGLQSVAEQYMSARTLARADSVEQEWIANSYQVEPWRGTKWGKSERVAKDKVNEWIKPGCIVIERRPEVILPEDRGNDELSFTANYKVRTTRVGVEWAEGTLKGKRLLHREDGCVCQYLVKPRGAAAEKRYQRTQRLAGIESDLRISWEYMTAEESAALRAEADELRKQLGLLK